MTQKTLKPTAPTQEPLRRTVLTPRVDILEQPEKLVLFVDLPGVKPDGVELNFERGELRVRGRRELPDRPGRCLVEQFESCDYYRTFLLSQDLAADKITAELKHGVLTVEMPRSEAAKPRRIAVS